MKKEAAKKSKKWLWLVIGLVALAAVAGVVLALVLGGPKDEGGPVGGRPDLYWNIDKEYYTANSESGLSTREPGEDGVYRVRFAYNGEQVELTVADKRLVNTIDTMDAMGIVQDADGVVVDVVAAEDFMTPVAINAYVQQVMEDKIIANSSIAMNGMQYVIELCDLTQIYDVSDTAEVAGQRIEAAQFLPMDSVWVYANDMEENTHIYMTDHPVTSAVYWRAYQMWNSTEKATSRVPDENGVYSIDFCSDGGIVTLKCKDKSIVSSIDNKSPHSCHFGFVFDEEGYIVEIMNSGVGIRGAVAAERIEVTEIDGTFFSGSQLIPSDGGLSYSANLPEGCVIYDASSAAERDGCQGQKVDSLKLGDRVCVWTDATGSPMLIYIANRLVDVPTFYNLTRKYDGTLKETTRERSDSGYYEFEVVQADKQGEKIVKTKDKDLATFIDAISNSMVGLKLDGSTIVNAYTVDDVHGWSPVYGGYVTQIQGSIVSVVSFSRPDTPTNILLEASIKFYDVSGKDVPYGTETTLREGDIVTVGRNVSYGGIIGFVTRRLVGGDRVYYNLDYQYNSKTQETNRTPDEEGWYTFTMAHKGKQVEVKTKNKELASKIDKSPLGDLVDVMRVENGIAYELYESAAAYGQVLRSGWRISAVGGDGTYTLMNSKGVEQVVKMADDCVIYNVSPVYDSHRGERIYSLKVGDMVTTLADYRSEAKLIYVRQRCVDKMYVNKQRLYDTTNKVTLRQPDAEGWYWYELAVDGEVKWFKTNDVTLANTIDSYTSPFGLRVDGDLIRNITSPVYVKGVYKAGINGWDVVSVSGNSVKIKLNKPGYTDTGKTQTITTLSKVKVYDISPTAESFGAAVKLQKGDRIRVYLDREDNCVYIYVLFHESRVKGSYGYCEHCEQEVFWNPWAGDSWDGVTCHYYLAGSVEITKQTNVGNDSKDYEVVLDLNGNKLTVAGARAFMAFRGDDLSILDSVGGGEVTATGVEGGNGGTLFISGESTVNLYSGTLTFTDSDIHVYKGAVVYVSTGCTFNMYGGTVKGGIVNSPDKNVQGGNIFLYGGTFNMYDGVVEGGRAERTEDLKPAVAAQGGNIYGVRNGTMNLYGGVIRDGWSNQHGGNIFLSTCTLNMSGGTVTGGECMYSGGNFYGQFASVFNISGGTVENGKAGAMGNNLYSSQDTFELNISGGTISGDLVIGKAKSVSVSGAPKVAVGEKSGLSIPTGVKMTLGELTKGAEIFVNARGAFTEPNSNAQAYADAGYIKPAAPRTTLKVENNVMVMEGEVSYCEHCGEMVSWFEWPGTSNPESGHYFIAKDYQQAAQLTIKADTDVVLDLYGKTYSSEKIRNFLVRGTLSIMDSVGGGVMVSTGGEEFAGSIALVGTEKGSEKPAGFNLYSGTLKLAEGHPEFANGGLIQFGGGELNVYGGTMIGGHVTGRGGCVNVNNSGSVMNIYGGTISGGTAGISGGCIDMSGTLNVYGGTVDGEVYIEPSCKGVNLSGAPVIENLNLTSGIRADVSGLTEGAKIGITADSTFTKPLENPVEYLPYFTLLNSDSTIQASGAGLEVSVSKEQIADRNAIYAEAVKMTTDGIFAAGGTVTADCPVCGTSVQWLDFNALEGNKITEDAHYYLSADVESKALYSLNGNICLHLNGHNLTSAARAIYVELGYHLNVMGDGVVSGVATKHDTFGWWGVLDVPGSVDLYGGTFRSTNSGPAVSVRGNKASSVVNMYEGTKVVRTDNLGIGVRLYDDGDFKMYGGEVSGAQTNFLLESGKNTERTVALSIYGGTVETASTAVGGNIHATGASASISLYSAKVLGGSVYLDADTKGILLTGTPEVTQLNLVPGAKASLLELEKGTSVGVVANGAFTVKNKAAAAYLEAGYFHTATSRTSLRIEEDVLFMDVTTVRCEHCGQDIIWTVWPGISSPVSGHYYLEEDYSGQVKQFSIVKDTDVVLDLNGKTYSTTGFRNFLVRGTLSIMDSVGSGVMVSTGGEEFAGSIALVSTEKDSVKPAGFNLYSGTLKLAEDHPQFANGGLIQFGGGELNMYGGAMIGGHVTGRGGCVNVSGANSVMNLYGGTVSGGTAGVSGGCIDVYGALNVKGGTVDGEVYIENTAKGVSLSGAPVIAELNLLSGIKADVSGLTSGAKIGLTADGVFTTALTDPEAFIAYFTPSNELQKIVVEGDALKAFKEEGAEKVYNSIHVDAEKMTADGVFAAGGTVTAQCPVCEAQVQWQDLNALENKKITEDGHYYLSDDIQTDSHYGINANICLHLNGHNITSDARAFYVELGYHMNAMGEGIVSGAPNKHATLGWWGAVDVPGSVDLFGGTYLATNDGAAIAVRGNKSSSAVNMYDGAKIARTDGAGIGVRLYDDGNFMMYGGEVTGAKTNFLLESGKYAERSAALGIYGGKIETTSTALGGNIHASGANASVELYSAKLLGGSVYMAADAKALLLSGTPEITQLNLDPGAKAILQDLENGTNVGVVASGAFTVENENAAAYLTAGYFHTVVGRTTLREDNGVLYMDVEKVYCAHCDKDIEWTLWAGVSSPASGHYYIDADYTAQTKQLSIAADTDVVLDLHGNTYSTTGIRNFLVRGTLSVMDTVGGGEMVTTGDTAAHGSVAYIATAEGSLNPACFNLYSGTLRLAQEHAEIGRGGVLQLTTGAILNMYGGTISGGEATDQGGNVNVGSADVAFNMYGGQILGGKAPNGASVNVIGSLNMQGGVIDGQVCVNAASTGVILSGDVQIGDLSLAEGKVADVSGLTTGAKIGVTAKGVFTTELTDPETYIQYFTLSDRLQEIVVEEKALSVFEEENAEKVYNNIHVEAEKMTADGVFAAGGVVTAQCPYCDAEVQWQELNALESMRIDGSAHYYLSGDISNETHYGIYGDVCLHLNGHNITSTGRAIYVDATATTMATINIMGQGTVTGAGVDHATIPRGTLDIGGTVNLFGGTYEHTGSNPIITARGFIGRSFINIFDGAVIRGSETAVGDSIRIRSNAVNVYGGVITGGNAVNGGNIYLDGAATCSLNVYGGTIENGTAQLGGNIYAAGAKASVHIQDVTISGGDVCLADGAQLTLSGETSVDVLKLKDGICADISGLTEASRIGVIANGAFTVACDQAEALLTAGCFAPAADKMQIRHENGVLYMDVKVEKVFCEHCNEEVEWDLWSGAANPASGHYYIDADFSGQTKQLSIAAGADVVLDLRGHTYSTTGIRNFLVRGALSIMDTVGGGQMVSAGVADANGAIALVAAASGQETEAVFNLYSGALKLAGTHAEINIGGILWVSSGTFNMYGGSVENGAATEYGGNLAIEKNGTFHMYGGQVLGGSAPVGGDIAMYGTMNMEGGSVEGEVYVGATGNVKLSNAVSIGNLHIADGRTVDVTGLTVGAQLGVTAQGVFTTTLSDAQAYLDYFVKLKPEDEYQVVDNAISLVTLTELDRLNAVHTKAEAMTADGVFAAGGTVSAVCPVCGTEEQWQELNLLENIGSIKTGGHYYLSADVSNTKFYGFYADSCLHLNGHSITSSERAIYVDATSTQLYTLNIMGEGTVSGAGLDHATIPRGTLDIGGSVNFFGGKFVATGNNPALTARGFIGRSVINVYDGTEFSAPNVSILVRSNAVNVYGGAVTAGTVKVDGGATCEMNVYGGTMENANADQAAIQAAGTKGTVTISGGNIGTLVAAADLKTLTVTGTPVIANLDLTSGKLLTLGTLSEGAQIYVTADGTITDTFTDAESYLDYIFAAQEGFEVLVQNDALYVRQSPMAKGNQVHLKAEKMTDDGIFSAGGDIVAQCPVCEEEVTWKDLNAHSGQKITEKSHFYLSDDLQLTTHYSTTVGYCLHLNGHNVTSTQRVLYVEYCTVNIMGEGIVTGGFTSAKGYGSTIDAPGNVNLYGGTYTSTVAGPVITGRSNLDHVISMYDGASIVRDGAVPGVNVRLYDHNDFNMYGGIVSGGSVSGANGGNFLLVSGNVSRDVKLSIYGGTVENGTADLGGNIYADGASCVVNICGGTVTGGDVYIGANVKSVSVSGAPVVSELDLTSGKLLTLGRLTANADITVSAADGAFTETHTKASSYVEFFKAAIAGKKVTSENDALVMADA